MGLKVLLVDEDPDRAASVREALVTGGCEVLTTLSSALELYDRVAEYAPDVIIIDTDSPSRDVIEHITFISRDQPRPIVMFSGDREMLPRAARMLGFRFMMPHRHATARPSSSCCAAMR